MMSDVVPIPITVIGGYLGAGKTTLLNALLHRVDGRRLGIVVNDFGELGVDADVLRAASGETTHDGATSGVPVVNLANGCVCCTLGDDLRATLHELAAVEPRLDQIVIEASGVADPAVAAAWGTVPGFVPGGVVVLAAADAVMTNARDRYVGGEVIRQLVGADLVIVTKSDACPPDQVDRVVDWIGAHTPAPVVFAVAGDLDPDVVLGPPSGHGVAGDRPAVARTDHVDVGGHVTWSTSTGVVDADDLEDFLAGLPTGVLRLKGFVDVRDRSGDVGPRLVQVVGRTVSVVGAGAPGARGLVAIGVGGALDPGALHAHASAHRILPFS